MKMKKRKLTGLSLIMALSLFSAGCGSAGGGSKSETADAAAAEVSYASENYATDDIYMSAAETTEAETTGAESADMGEGAETPKVQDTERKLIRNVSLSVETEAFEDLLQTVTEKAESLGGYVESSNTYNGSYYYGNSTRNASLTLRIPAEKLDEFLSAVAENSNVISRDENVTDVTLQYVDMKSHKEALLTEQERLLELLEQAESVEDIITIESRLSDVRYQIESMESQLRTMDNQVSYSTVYLYIDEVARLTPVKEQTTAQKIKTGFAESLYDVGNGIKNFVIGFIIRLPYLVVWAAVILIIVLVLRLWLKRSGKRKASKQEKKQKCQQKAICGEDQKEPQEMKDGGSKEQKEEKKNE